MLEGSYGFFGIGRRYVENENLTAANFNHQELWFRPFSNPDAVLPDPDCKEPDWSDQNFCFVLDPITREEFKRQHPRAQFKDFSSEQMQIAKSWLSDRTVLRAEYWKVHTTEQKVYLLDGKLVYTLPKGAQPDDERTILKRSVVQYLTNGIEILKRNPQPGTMIPIIPVTGLERYVNEGAGPKRKLFSLVRVARDPQLTLAFLCSQEMEEASLTPKVPFRGWKGQFESDAEAHENIYKTPHAMVQYDYPDWALERGIPVALPERVQFTPNFQAYEIAKDGARRAIQAAMGISPLPTAAQRNNEKSGVALERIETAQDIGSYHFVDGLERAMMYAGRVANEYIGAIHTDEQEMMLRKADDSNRHVRLNTAKPYLNEKTNELEHYPIDDGSHTVTISSGPSDASQRAEVKQFIDTLLQNLQSIPAPPPVLAQIVAMAIRMKGLGPKGDQLADLISPPDQGQQMPPEAQQAVQRLQQQHDALNEYAKQLEGKMQQLQFEKMAKVVDNQARMELEKLKIDADLAKAEIMTKAQSIEERVKFIEDAWQQLHGQAHEAGMQAQEQAHAQEMAQQQAEEPGASGSSLRSAQRPEQPAEQAARRKTAA